MILSHAGDVAHIARRRSVVLKAAVERPQHVAGGLGPLVEHAVTVYVVLPKRTNVRRARPSGHCAESVPLAVVERSRVRHAAGVRLHADSVGHPR